MGLNASEGPRNRSKDSLNVLLIIVKSHMGKADLQGSSNFLRSEGSLNQHLKLKHTKPLATQNANILNSFKLQGFRGCNGEIDGDGVSAGYYKQQLDTVQEERY